MTEEEQVKQLKREKKSLQDQLDRVKENEEKKKEKKKKVRSWLFRKSSLPLLGVRLKQSIASAINEYKEQKTVSVDTVSDVSSNIIWRLTRIGIFAFMISIVPALILVFQTTLLVNQNKLITSQNNLIEADRRSSLVFVMSDVLSDMNEELKYKGSSERNISRTLEARIITLCMAMKPYRYMENGTLISQQISPERGQLLFTLLKSDLGSQSSQDILNSADFNYTNLRGINMGRGAKLKYARLDYSDFSNAQMPAANLESSDLKGVNMYGANLSDAVFIKANLIKANLKNSELLSADLTKANLFGADLTNADLSEAKLWGTKLENADLTDVVLDNVIVHRQDWISYVSDSLGLKGGSAIKKKYRIKKQAKKQFVIVARK